MSENNTGPRSNRISVCPLSNKVRRMKSQEKYKKEEYITDLKRGEQVYAVKSYSDQRNNISLTFMEGDIITLLDQFSDGMCKGYISKFGPDSKVGVFPTTCVVPYTKNNINSSNTANLGKCTRKMNEFKEKSFNSPVKIREKEKSSIKGNIPQMVANNTHTYSCNYSEIRKSPTADIKVIQPIDTLNRGSTCSVDSGRGSTTVTMMNSAKMNMPISLVPVFDQPQYIPENYVCESIESGLASYQRHSSSSSSSIGGGSSTDGSKQNIGFMDNEYRHMLNTTLEEEDRDENIIKSWLQTMGLEIYSSNFILSGYDFNTLLRMTPEDLNAIGITDPKHRKLIKNDISIRINNIQDTMPETIPATVEEWLIFLNLTPYLEIISQQGYDDVEKLIDLTWEDLEEIGIKKLGHQKKIILAVEKLKKLLKNYPNDKLSMSYSAENFRDSKSKFLISDSSPNHRVKNESQALNSAYLDLSRYSAPRPIPPVRKISHLSDSSFVSSSFPLYSPVHSSKSNIADANVPPPTPKRISSIISGSKEIRYSSQKSRFRKPYENIAESIDMHTKVSKFEENKFLFASSDSNSAQIIMAVSPTNFNFRSSSIMLKEAHCLPFANENCGTIKQRSSSLDRTEALREEIELGTLNCKSNIIPIVKPVLPLILPYNIDLLSFKSISSTQKFTVNLPHERNIQRIPTDVHVALQEKVPLPKLHVEDNSSNEDFNEICDMLEDLTELLGKEVSRNH